MLTVAAKGSIAEVIQHARDVHGRLVPYAAATALTRTARIAMTVDIPAEMRRVFDRPTPYTLNALRLRPATKETLSARVEVKTDAPSGGTPAEDYLLPSVDGGGRKEKRLERNLRYAGILKPGWRAMPAEGAPLDAYGNIPRGEIQKILTAVRASFDKWQNRSDSARSRRNAKNAPYFVARPGSMAPGIYRRDGLTVKPVLIFTDKLPQYRKRLDFEAVVQRTAETNFQPEFNRALAALLSR